MLKLILCGYTQSIFSDRKIEVDSIRRTWLTQSQTLNFRNSYFKTDYDAMFT